MDTPERVSGTRERAPVKGAMGSDVPTRSAGSTQDDDGGGRYLSICIAESRQPKHFLAGCLHTIHPARGNMLLLNPRGKYMTTQHTIWKDTLVMYTFQTHTRMVVIFFQIL